MNVGSGPAGRKRRWIEQLLLAVGERAFSGVDDAARCEGWTVTVQRGGLRRSYRDPRFDSLRDRRLAAMSPSLSEASAGSTR